MTLSSPASGSPAGFRWVALLVAVGVGLCGLYPHLRWSFEVKQLAWFYNSYDEGYYGWLSFSGFSFNRGLSDLVMHSLYLVSGSNAQLAMILADFFLPLGVTLAACFMVRPLFARPAGMAAGALFVMVSAECWALRSTLIPHAALHEFLQQGSLALLGGNADIVQLGNQTSTFWLFRTPEPQVSWIIMFVALGLALRIISTTPERRPHWGWLAASCFLAGTGYLFCALPICGVFFLFSALEIWSHQRENLLVGACGLICFGVCIGLSIYSAGQYGGESLIFASHRPVLLISVLLGLTAAGVAIVGSRSRQLQSADLFALSLAFTPLCVANQQLLTGRMIYLMNFENFGLSQIGALALLMTVFQHRSLTLPIKGRIVASDHLSWRAAVFAVVATLLLGGIMLRSQLLSYTNYLAENRLARSYELALKSLPVTTELIACDDFFQTDTLAIRLGRRPNYLIARDKTFSTPIGRLRSSYDIPVNSAEPRQALYEYLALTGVTSTELSKRFSAIVEPDNPSWQDRFLLGGLLYNHADFWAPLTHGRDAKLAWIKAQKSTIVDEYTRFHLRGNIVSSPVIFIMRDDKPAPVFLADHHARRLPVSNSSAPIPLKAYRVEAITAP